MQRHVFALVLLMVLVFYINDAKIYFVTTISFGCNWSVHLVVSTHLRVVKFALIHHVFFLCANLFICSFFCIMCANVLQGPTVQVVTVIDL